MNRYGIAMIWAATLFVSCARDDDATRGGGDRALAVQVQMQHSDWQTRSDNGSATASAPGRTQVLGSAAIDEQLEVVAQCEPMGYTHDTPFTRGTPMGSAADLQSMGFSVYTNSAFVRTLTATYKSGSWVVADNILLNLDKEKYDYYAYAPVATADNGIVLRADGKQLTYTAPAEVIQQPDLCWATPILNDETGKVTFAMQHALTAIGVKVRADDVEIQSIKLVDVHTSGKLDLTTSTNTWTALDLADTVTFRLTTTLPKTGNNVVDITPNNGYLMLPPQTLIADTKKLQIIYRYSGETAWRKGTHSLNTLTGGAWTAGQKVYYIIQLKAKFTLALSPATATVQASASSFTFNYTTGSEAASIDPQVSCSESWITNLRAIRSSGSGTIVFDYATRLPGASRTADIIVTSGFTSTKFRLTQLPDIRIALSPTAPAAEVPQVGGSYTASLTTSAGVAWKVTSMSYCSVSPSSGVDNTTVTITVPSTLTDRTVSATISTNVGEGVTEKTAVWSGKQTKVPAGCWPTPLPGYPNVYVALADATGDWGNFFMGGSGEGVCLAWGGYLPSIDELKAMHRGKSNYGTFDENYSTYYWSSTLSDSKYWRLEIGSTAGNSELSEFNYMSCVRCVKEAK